MASEKSNYPRARPASEPGGPGDIAGFEFPEFSGGWTGRLPVGVLAALPAPEQPSGLIIRSANDADLLGLARFKNLEMLDLLGTKVSDPALKDLGRLKNLQALMLFGTKVTDAGLKELAGLNNLRKLNLEGTQVTDDGLKVLAHLNGCMRWTLPGLR